MHRLHLLWADFLFDPQELTLSCEILNQTLFFQVGKDFDQLLRGHFGVDQMAWLRVERVGLKVRRQQVAVAVCDVGARGRDHGPRRVAARLGRLRHRQQPHTPADHGEGTEKTDAKDQQPPLGAHPGLVAHLLMADAFVLTLDRIGIFALFTGIKNTSQRAKRGADHSKSSSDSSAPVSAS